MNFGDKCIYQYKMKTIEEWFKTLPKGLKESALANIITENKNLKMMYLSEAIAMGIDWESSNEGGEFWHLMYQDI